MIDSFIKLELTILVPRLEVDLENINHITILNTDANGEKLVCKGYVQEAKYTVGEQAYA